MYTLYKGESAGSPFCLDLGALFQYQLGNDEAGGALFQKTLQQGVEMLRHTFAHSLIRKPSVSTKHIIDDMFDLAGLGYHGGNRWV